MSAGHLVLALRYSLASGARRPPAGGLRMEAQRAGTPALAGGAVYDSRPQRGTPRPTQSAFSWRPRGFSVRGIYQVLQGFATL